MHTAANRPADGATALLCAACRPPAQTQTMRVSHGHTADPDAVRPVPLGTGSCLRPRALTAQSLTRMPPAQQETSRSTWLEQMQRNEPEPYTVSLKQQLKSGGSGGAEPPSADAVERFAQFADALDDGLCRLAAVAIAQNAILAVKSALFNEAATTIQAAERRRQAMRRFKVAVSRSRDARLKRLLATALKLGVLTLLLVILILLWLSDSGASTQQCVAPPPTCRPRPAAAAAPPPPPQQRAAAYRAAAVPGMMATCRPSP